MSDILKIQLPKSIFRSDLALITSADMKIFKQTPVKSVEHLFEAGNKKGYFKYTVFKGDLQIGAQVEDQGW
tara:strand:+ start:197 stop:409 length:213 start_codon:yes stop_codon:yes gene_type:complete